VSWAWWIWVSLAVANLFRLRVVNIHTLSTMVTRTTRAVTLNRLYVSHTILAGNHHVSCPIVAVAKNGVSRIVVSLKEQCQYLIRARTYVA
jgi:hypothetical protein